MPQARKPAKLKRPQASEQSVQQWQPQQEQGGQMVPAQNQSPQQQQQQQQPQYVTTHGPVRQSRIKDRPEPQETRDSSLKVKIELDLEAEVDLYARVKGDVTIGLM